ncbi:hypothetical protein [Xanthomonas prunicola]|jgi:hypothetical protein|uniref:Uncharacterized protein n=1 Tax=Xanthomonas prunicola TaxID=2053930 RepID=A0A2N3RLQ8_9XANT|nr:hypothetical protein [Xanthomonas prunicola]PKV13432.1 hypothetical protein XpruCFBP8353_09530 [Xanthomonas prunicola]PKV17707.1 hypothetical protein XpruCFBP8354_09530 [Xanthomonas prunicola]PKV21605.1 hypothetical protein CVO74_11585 [Xanthomonas prunicola]
MHRSAGDAAVERLHCCDHGKPQQELAMFSRPAITVIAPARNLDGLTYASTGKQWISKPERFKASPIRLPQDSPHNAVLLWAANQTRIFSDAAQWAKASRHTLHLAGSAQPIAARVIPVAGKWPGSLPPLA